MGGYRFSGFCEVIHVLMTVLGTKSPKCMQAPHHAPALAGEQVRGHVLTQ